MSKPDYPRWKGWNLTKRKQHQLTRKNPMRVLDERIEQAIEEEGFFIMGVFPTAESPGPHFAYTVGLAPDVAELVMFGLDIETMAHIFHAIVEQQKEGETFQSGRAYPGLVEGSFPLYLRIITDEEELIDQYMRAAYRWHGKHGRTVFPVMQVIWPDSQGKFPWESGFEERFRAQQPLLGWEPDR